MTKAELDKLAKAMAKYFNTTVEDIYEEEMESDAGFDLQNGITFQHASYAQNAFLVCYFDGRAMHNLKEFGSANALLVGLGEVQEKIEKLLSRAVAS